MRRFILLLTAFACLSPPIVGHAQSGGGTSWPVRLADGTDTPVMVSSNSGVLEFRAGKRVTFTIPVSSITEILHSTQPIHRSTQVQNYFENLCCGGTQSKLLPALVTVLARPFGYSRKHYVEIHWYKNGDGASVLELDKDEYIAFMDWLQNLSGVKWVDVAKEAELALSNIQKHAGGAFAVRVGHPSAETLLVLPMDLHGEKQLYFFRGEVATKNLIGIAPVKEVWSENPCVRGSDVLYKNCDQGRCELDAVMLPEATFQIMSPVGTTQTDEPGNTSSDCTKLAQQQMNWSKQETDSRVKVQVRSDKEP